MRIAYLLPSLRTSGWRRYAESLLPALSGKVEPHLLIAAEDAPLSAELFPQWPRYLLPAVQDSSLSGRRSRWALLGRVATCAAEATRCAGSLWQTSPP